MKEIEFVIYVSDQKKSRDFYQELLQMSPVVDVPGMTEFQLSDSVKLGLMPYHGIAKILCPTMPHPKTGHGIPRCEIYLKVEDASACIKRGIHLGGILVSNLQTRDWGDKVGYIADLDGHIIAFAETSL